MALHLGHRQSVDFDFFTDQPLNTARLYKEMPFLNSAVVLQQEQNTFTVAVEAGHAERTPVKVSFFGSITFGRVGEPETTDDGVLVTASPLDLLGTKPKVAIPCIPGHSVPRRYRRPGGMSGWIRAATLGPACL